MEYGIDDIKEKNVAAAILIETRSLNREEKAVLLAVTEGMQHNECMRAEDNGVMTLSSLELDEEDREFLNELYEEGVFTCYSKIIQSLCKSYSEFMSFAKGRECSTEIIGISG